MLATRSTSSASPAARPSRSLCAFSESTSTKARIRPPPESAWTRSTSRCSARWPVIAPVRARELVELGLRQRGRELLAVEVRLQAVSRRRSGDPRPRWRRSSAARARPAAARRRPALAGPRSCNSARRSRAWAAEVAPLGGHVAGPARLVAPLGRRRSGPRALLARIARFCARAALDSARSAVAISRRCSPAMVGGARRLRVIGLPVGRFLVAVGGELVGVREPLILIRARAVAVGGALVGVGRGLVGVGGGLIGVGDRLLGAHQGQSRLPPVRRGLGRGRHRRPRELGIWVVADIARFDSPPYGEGDASGGGRP